MSSVLKTVLNYQEQNTDYLALEQASIERDKSTLNSLYVLADSIQSLSASNEDFGHLTSKVSLEGVVDSIIEHAKKIAIRIKNFFVKMFEWFRSILKKFIGFFKKKEEEAKKPSEDKTQHTHEIEQQKPNETNHHETTAAQHHEEPVHHHEEPHRNNYLVHKPREHSVPERQKQPVFEWNKSSIIHAGCVLFAMNKPVDRFPSEFTEHDVKEMHANVLKQLNETKTHFSENMEKLKSVVRKLDFTPEAVAANDTSSEIFDAIGHVFQESSSTTAKCVLKSIFGDFIINLYKPHANPYNNHGDYNFVIASPEKFREVFYSSKKELSLHDLNERNSTMPKIPSTMAVKWIYELDSSYTKVDKQVIDELLFYDIHSNFSDRAEKESEASGNSKTHVAKFFRLSADFVGCVQGYFHAIFNYFIAVFRIIEKTTL